MTTQHEPCLDSFPAYTPPEDLVFIEHEVLVPNEYGGNYLRRKRYCTPKEIYSQLHKFFNVRVCNECGHEEPEQHRSWDKPCPKCGSENRICLIDEYDSCCHFGGEEDVEIAPREWHVCTIMVYCEPGSNEGYSFRVSIRLYHQNGRDIDAKVVDVYRIKSFLGMDHCLSLVRRGLKVMGLM